MQLLEISWEWNIRGTLLYLKYILVLYLKYIGTFFSSINYIITPLRTELILYFLRNYSHHIRNSFPVSTFYKISKRKNYYRQLYDPASKLLNSFPFGNSFVNSSFKKKALLIPYETTKKTAYVSVVTKFYHPTYFC